MKHTLDNATRDILRSLVAELGSDVNEHTQKWRGYLTDRMAAYRLERQALITALNEHVPEELMSSQSAVQPQAQVERLTQRMVESLGLQPEVARWAVESWALALGVMQPQDLKSMPATLVKHVTIAPPQRRSRRWKLAALAAIGTAAIVAIPIGLMQTRVLPSLSFGGGGTPDMRSAGLKTLKVGAYLPVFNRDQNRDANDANRPDPKENYNKLKDHLKAELRKRLSREVDVQMEFIEISGHDSFEQMKTKLKNKEWDLAFTQNPLLSVAAQQNQYEFAARMVGFSGSEELQAALVTHVDSPIKSLQDIDKNPGITIALEGSDTPRFYLSVYDAFGRSLKVDPNNRSGRDITTKVLERKAELGIVSAQWVSGEIPANLPPRLKERREQARQQLRLLSSTRTIPTAGVYLSSNLDVASRALVRQILLEAPDEIQTAGRYGKGDQPDYSEFVRVVDRVDNKVLACTDPQKWMPNERVQFFCNAVTGKVNSVAQVDAQTSQLTLLLEGNKTVKVVLPVEVSKAAGFANISDLNAQRIVVLNVAPDAQTGELRISDPKQIKLATAH
jgi:ABC-type phosphate/phosphonate transport system substrate-binding protein